MSILVAKAKEQINECIMSAANAAMAEGSLEKAELTEVRGFKGVREAAYDLNGKKVKIAVAHGMKNAKVLLEDIRAGKSEYQFIEIMGCPGGCIAGAGTVIPAETAKKKLAAHVAQAKETSSADGPYRELVGKLD